MNSALNPNGDSNGDLWPTITEGPSAPHYPMVVWSKFNGANYDIAWSRWTDHGWAPVEWLMDGEMPGDDLDADLVIDAHGERPYLVWWSDTDSAGKVYFSVYLADNWIPPLLISNPEVDSRYPTVEVVAEGMLKVLYDTPNGTVTQFVALGSPDTITDDINPQSCIYLNISSAMMHFRKQ
jgi:hypothetical protein